MSAPRRRPVEGQLPAFASEHVSITTARESEYVPTPPWVVAALVLGLRRAGHPPLPAAGVLVESAAGGGALALTLEACLGPRPGSRWIACELRSEAAMLLRVAPWAEYETSVTIREGDYLTLGAGHTGAGLWITNPPYSRAADYLAKNFEEAAGVGTVALHVPWAFAATAALEGLDADLYPIEGRPYSFVRETCWIVLGPGRGGRRLLLRRSK